MDVGSFSVPARPADVQKQQCHMSPTQAFDIPKKVRTHKHQWSSYGTHKEPRKSDGITSHFRLRLPFGSAGDVLRASAHFYLEGRRT